MISRDQLAWLAIAIIKLSGQDWWFGVVRWRSFDHIGSLRPYSYDQSSIHTDPNGVCLRKKLLLKTYPIVKIHCRWMNTEWVSRIWTTSSGFDCCSAVRFVCVSVWNWRWLVPCWVSTHRSPAICPWVFRHDSGRPDDNIGVVSCKTLLWHDPERFCDYWLWVCPCCERSPNVRANIVPSACRSPWHWEWSRHRDDCA